MTSTSQTDMYKMKADSDVFLALMLSDHYESKDKSPLDTSPSSPISPTSPISLTQEPISPGSDAGAESQQDTMRTLPPTNDDAINNLDVIWVPAHKHPEIAPSEFANWLQSQGNTPTRRTSSLSRRSSVLSQSHTSDSDETENSTLPLRRTSSSQKRDELKMMIKEEESLKDVDIRSYVFDQYSTAQDDSKTILPAENRTLLRRSAFSARGRGRNGSGASSSRSERRANRRRAEVSKPTQDSPTPTAPIEGVRLYDRPVSISEWIDLGSASLESDDSQHGILSRVNAAETLLYLRLQDETKSSEESAATTDSAPISPTSPTSPTSPVTTATSEPTSPEPTTVLVTPPLPSSTSTATTPSVTPTPSIFEETASVASVPVAPTEPNPPTATRDTSTLLKASNRPGLRRSVSEKRPSSKSDKKSSSWLVGLFHDNKKNRRVEDESKPERKKGAGHLNQVQTASPVSTVGKKSGLVSLFSRSLSIKSSFTPSSTTPSTPAKPFTAAKKRTTPDPQFYSYRLPIHVERAVYRLSHFKLADPRRALRHQVLISNFMFWYLSIINTPAPTGTVEAGKENLSHGDTEKRSNKMSRLISSTKKRRDVKREPHLEQQEVKTGKNQTALTRPFQRSNDTTPQEPSDEDDNRPLSYFTTTS